MMLGLLLVIALAVAEGGPLPHSPLFHQYEDTLINHDLLNDIHSPYPGLEILHDLFHGKGQLLMSTHRAGPSGDAGKHGVRSRTAEYSSTPAAVSPQVSLPSDFTADHERPNGEEMVMNIDTTETLIETERSAAQGPERRQTTATPSSGEDHLALSRRRNPGDIPHRRHKRFILGNKLRSIAVPLSVFNFLGFLPVRVPGLPYHNDLPSPDYSHYDTTYEIYIPRRRRRFRFYD